MRRLWRRFLDWVRPNYHIGYDPAHGTDYETAVIVQQYRDGRPMRVVAWSYDKAQAE